MSFQNTLTAVLAYDNYMEGNGGVCLKDTSNELDLYIKLYTLLYADDTILLAETAQGMQSMLDKLFSYCQTWKLQVNPSKTKVVIFSKGHV